MVFPGILMHYVDIIGLQLAAQHLAVNHVLAAPQRDDIDLILNFYIPSDAEDYVHRVGRTARAERSGLAISFINADDVYKFQKIERLIDRVIHKIPLPEGFKAGPEYKSQSEGKKYSSKRSFKKKPFKK